VATLVTESREVDTSNESNISYLDMMSFPDFKIQALNLGVPSKAYIHGDHSRPGYDYDLFSTALKSGEIYQIRVTSSDPSVSISHLEIKGEGSFYAGPMNKDDAGFSTIYSFFGLDGVCVLGLGASSVSYPTDEPGAIKSYEITVTRFAREPAIPKFEVEKVALLYEAALDRKPDIPGLNYWIDTLEAGVSIRDIAGSFTNSAEFTSNFNTTSNDAFVAQLYLNVLGRNAEQAGADYWLGVMGNGHSRSDVLVGFAESAENRANAADWLGGVHYEAVTDMWML